MLVYVRVIYKRARARFYFSSFFFCYSFLSLLLVPRLSTCFSFLSISLKSCFISLHISSLLLTRAPSLPSVSLTLSSLPSFSLSGRLYSLLNQYYSLVCKNCRTTRPDISLYSFIYEKVSSPVTADAPDSAKDSGMSPVTSDSH